MVRGRQKADYGWTVRLSEQLCVQDALSSSRIFKSELRLVGCNRLTCSPCLGQISWNFQLCSRSRDEESSKPTSTLLMQSEMRRLRQLKTNRLRGDWKLSGRRACATLVIVSALYLQVEARHAARADPASKLLRLMLPFTRGTTLGHCPSPQLKIAYATPALLWLQHCRAHAMSLVNEESWRPCCILEMGSEGRLHDRAFKARSSARFSLQVRRSNAEPRKRKRSPPRIERRISRERHVANRLPSTGLRRRWCFASRFRCHACASTAVTAAEPTLDCPVNQPAARPPQ